jgi:hypothetical protein
MSRRPRWDPVVQRELEDEGREMINALREFLGLDPLYGARGVSPSAGLIAGGESYPEPLLRGVGARSDG